VALAYKVSQDSRCPRVQACSLWHFRDFPFHLYPVNVNEARYLSHLQGTKHSRAQPHGMRLKLLQQYIAAEQLYYNRCLHSCWLQIGCGTIARAAGRMHGDERARGWLAVQTANARCAHRIAKDCGHESTSFGTDFEEIGRACFSTKDGAMGCLELCGVRLQYSQRFVKKSLMKTLRRMYCTL